MKSSASKVRLDPRPLKPLTVQHEERFLKIDMC
jgi:hypothetical protein